MIPRPNQRRGVTLVELLAAMATMTIIMGVGAALLTMLLKLSDSGHEHAEGQAALARAARTFREDVRNASEVSGCEAGKASDRLVLTSGDWGVAYSVAKTGLVRVEWIADVVLEQETMPMSGPSRFERPDEPGPPVVTLLLERADRAGARTPAKPLRIDAALGASTRFRTSGGTSR
jgi:hypothetical protein